MTTAQSREFMRAPYEEQREGAWKELRDMILPAIITAATGAMAYKGFKKLKSMPQATMLPVKLTPEQKSLMEYKRVLKESLDASTTDIPYQTAKKLEQWMRGR